MKSKTSGLICFIFFIFNFNSVFAEWKIKTVDSNEGAGKFSSIAVDKNNYPHISYYQYGAFKYTYYNGISWNTEILRPESFTPDSTSIAIDSNNLPHIVSGHHYINRGGWGYFDYYFFDGNTWDRHRGSSSNVSLALDKNNLPHISSGFVYDNVIYSYYDGSTWHSETVPVVGDVFVLSTRIDLDSNNLPHIVFIESCCPLLINPVYKYIFYDGTIWHVNEGDSSYRYIAIDSNDTPHFSSNPIAIDSNDIPHTSYSTGGSIMHAYYVDGEYHEETVSSTDGSYTSIALDRNNNPHISFYSAGSLKYAYQDFYYDYDHDNVYDDYDNCPYKPNSSAKGTCTAGENKGDNCTDNATCGTGGLCSMNQEDSDNDTVGDACDNCIHTSNPSQIDCDNDTWGDACDPEGINDSDGDLIDDACDACPFDPENDTDSDGICGDVENCPSTPNGPELGTCVMTSGIVYASNLALSQLCTDNSTCGVGEICQKEQGDMNSNGIGDACECYADLNGEGKVNSGDLIIMKLDYNRTDCATNPCSADINLDNKVNSGDLLIMKKQYNRSGCPVDQTSITTTIPTTTMPDCTLTTIIPTTVPPTTITTTTAPTTTSTILRDCIINISILPPEGGNTLPPPPQHFVEGCFPEEIQAIPNIGFQFNHWENEHGNIISYDNPVTVDFQNSSMPSIVAVFTN